MEKKDSPKGERAVKPVISLPSEKWVLKIGGYSHLFKSFPQFVMIHTVKDFSIVNVTEINVFLEFPCFLCDAANVGNLISGSSSFPKPSVDI